MSKLIPRDEIFDIYWYFAHERNEIFYRKMNGDPKPWTNDAILQKYKFTNTYRVNDRVSQYLLSNVIYNGKEYKPEDMMFRIILFKIFNTEPTWQALEKEFGDITLDNFDAEVYGEFIDKLSCIQPVESTAYMLYPLAGKYQSKHRNYLLLLEKEFKKKNLGERLLEARNFRKAFEVMNSVGGFGKFISYQYITDLNYSPFVNWQECDFTIPGGGAKRGIAKVFKSLGGLSEEQAIWYMYDHQEEEFAKRGYNFHKLGNKRRMQPIDCQNVFCETDKYCREAHPELKSACAQIKNTYTKSKPSINFIYPPKWGLDFTNDKK